MARKIEENADGRFYVDTNCINCSLCPEIAKEIFATNHEQGYEYVKKQPGNEADRQLVEEVIRLCPARAVQDSNMKQHRKGVNNNGRKL